MSSWLVNRNVGPGTEQGSIIILILKAKINYCIRETILVKFGIILFYMIYNNFALFSAGNFSLRLKKIINQKLTSLEYQLEYIFYQKDLYLKFGNS